jgi:pyruvate/2-oxoglutarate dehydrogenase complex dihydrolipoamide acyltransferase (E2) component
MTIEGGVRPVVLPELSLTCEEATVQQWLKSEGDRVARGELIVDLEVDKVTLSVEATEDGVLASIFQGVGQVVRWGDILATIRLDDGSRPA